jgi:hypothetical protein
VTASLYDESLSDLRDNIENLATWEARQEPDALARRCASDAVDAIDGAPGKLYRIRIRIRIRIRAELISEIRGR